MPSGVGVCALLARQRNPPPRCWLQSSAHCFVDMYKYIRAYHSGIYKWQTNDVFKAYAHKKNALYFGHPGSAGQTTKNILHPSKNRTPLTASIRNVSSLGAGDPLKPRAENTCHNLLAERLFLGGPDGGFGHRLKALYLTRGFFIRLFFAGQYVWKGAMINHRVAYRGRSEVWPRCEHCVAMGDVCCIYMYMLPSCIRSATYIRYNRNQD